MFVRKKIQNLVIICVFIIHSQRSLPGRCITLKADSYLESKYFQPRRVIQNLKLIYLGLLSEFLWFHFCGELLYQFLHCLLHLLAVKRNPLQSRFQAEERLWAAARLGSYLVRESDRKPGSYVLSYLGRTGINHFRITAVCGDFYIGGRQFDSLNDLVGYYTACSDLLKKERLVHPVAPPEPVNDKKVRFLC